MAPAWCILQLGPTAGRVMLAQHEAQRELAWVEVLGFWPRVCWVPKAGADAAPDPGGITLLRVKSWWDYSTYSILWRLGCFPQTSGGTAFSSVLGLSSTL